MTLMTADYAGSAFVLEELFPGLHASGYGQLGGGRSFAFHTLHRQLIIEVYRAHLPGPVPQCDDVVALGTRSVAGIDLNDARSVVAAVRDMVAAARPVTNTASRLCLLGEQ
jgi:hypothetical protein